MNAYLKILLASIITYFGLFLYARILGKKQVGQLTYFNYITGIAIGSMGANTLFQTVHSVKEGLFAITSWFVFSLILGILSLKSLAFKQIFDGNSCIVIKKGKINAHALRKMRLSISDLMMLLREQKVFSVADVDLAIFESNGKISVLKEYGKRMVTKKDLSILPLNIEFIPTVLIYDGQLDKKSLKNIGLTKQWLMSQLLNQGLKSYKDLLYVELGEDGTLHYEKR